ncbi:MAG TPA: TlpA disulfide reductase family protein [Acidimicrobiales bacterium]|nr:TlpA disulfide reductase family protein [Acidimicrobiales bacterium]
MTIVETTAVVDGPEVVDRPIAAPPRGAGVTTPRAVLAVAVLIAVAVAAALFIGQGASGPDGAVGAGAERLAPAFTLAELRAERGEVVLAAGPDRPTVVNFFAAWCEPCKRELPALRDAAAAHPDVAFLGVDHQDSRLDAIELLDAHRVTYPAGYDPRGDVAARYGVRGLPATVFISTDGRIVDFHQGELSVDELRERLDRLTLRKPAA